MGNSIKIKGSNINIENVFGGDYNVKNERIRSHIITHQTQFVPPSFFIGRENELNELYDKLNEKRCLIHISGMGGIGKTSFLRKLYCRYLDANYCPYDFVGMINYEEDFETSLIKCLKYEMTDRTLTSIANAWNELEYLASNGKLLLFVDHVEVSANDDIGLQNLFSIPCSIVVCSRRSSISDLFSVYPLDILPPSQCVLLYKNIVGSINFNEEKILCEILENKIKWHTQTVELLAKLAETKGWSVEMLKKNIENKGIEISFKENGELINLNKTMTRLFDLSKLGSGEINILEGFSLFPSISIARELGNELFVEDAKIAEFRSTPILKRFFCKDKKKQIQNRCEDCLKELERKGWLCGMNSSMYFMHPIISMTILENRVICDSKHEKLVRICCDKLNLEKINNNLDTWRFLSLAVQVAEKIKFQDIDKMINLYFKIAECYSINNHHEKALKWYRRIDNNIDQLSSEKSIDITKELMLKSAREFSGLGKYEKAVEVYKKTLDFLLYDESNNFDEIMYCYVGISSAYMMLECYKDAFVECCKSLQFIYRQNESRISLSTCRILYLIAEIYERVGIYKSQLKCYERIKTIFKKMQLTKYNDWANLNEHFGKACENMGEYDRALRYYQEILNLKQENKSYHPFTIARILQYISQIYIREENKDKYKEKAISYVLQAVSLCERETETGMELANVYNNTGNLYRALNQNDRAMDYYMKANQIYKEIYPKWHGLYNENICNIAGCLFEIKKYEEAERYINIAESNLNERWSKERQEHVVVYYCKGLLLIEHRQEEDGLKLCKKAYQLSMKINGSEHINTRTIADGCKIQYNKIYSDGEFEKWIELCEV